MSINQRQANLLRSLLKQRGFTPTAELARTLGCSERTVRNDTRAINVFMEQCGVRARTDSKRGNGIRLAASNAERERILGFVKERALAVNSALDRFYRGILLLTCDPSRNYTTETLAREILTNKQQAQDDIRSWNDMLEPYNAQITRGRQLDIEGPEEYIRFFIVYYLFESASTAMKRRIEPQLFAGNKDFLSDEIHAVERALDRPLTDNARHQLAIYLQVMVLRVSKGCTLSGFSPSVPPVFQATADHLEERFDIVLNAAERSMIRNLFTVATRRWTSDFNESYRPSPEAAAYTEALLGALERRFACRPQRHLETPLTALIEAGVTHMQLQMSITLPTENTWAVRFENMASFMRLTQVIRDTPALSELVLYETDYTRIAMLLLSFLDGLSAHASWRAGLVVNCGIEQVFYARDRLERLIPSLRIARVMPESEIGDGLSMSAEELDFLVSFDPVDTELPIAIISTGITESDRRRINDLLVQLEGTYSSSEDAPLAGDLPVRELSLDNGAALRRALHDALVDEGLWSGSLADFSPVFEMCSFTCGSWMVLTVFSHDVAATGAVRYEVDARMGLTGTRLHHIAVLTVALKDERILTPVSQRFREHLLAAGLKPNEF